MISQKAIYTHWLVTHGESPETCSKKSRLVPLVLVPVPVDAAARRRVQEIVIDEIQKRALVFTPAEASEVDRLKALTGEYLTKAFSNVWVRAVRLSTPGDPIWVEEESIEWVLATNPERKFPEDWQGAADKCIPKDTPVTIFERGAVAKLELLDQ